MADDDELEVPSPTFTLVQAYDLRIPVAHFDLYRLGDPAELTELGFDEALQDGVCLVEWPEMASGELPEDRIALKLEQEGAGATGDHCGAGKAGWLGSGAFLPYAYFIDDAGYPRAKRRFLTGDASLRAYEAVYAGDGTRRVPMDWPPLPGGPAGPGWQAVSKGRPYRGERLSLRRHCATCSDSRALQAPEVYRVDYDRGILLLEDLGADGVLNAQGQPITDRYRASVACLAHLHSLAVPQDIPCHGPPCPPHPGFRPDCDEDGSTPRSRLASALEAWRHLCQRRRAR